MRGVLNFMLKILKLLLKVAIVLLLVVGFYFGMDFIFKDILSYQARAVLSNFVVFSTIIIFVMFRVANASKMINDAQQAVSDEIYTSEKVRVESETRLASVEESMANIEVEIDNILSKSEQNANLVGEKLLTDAENSVLVLQDNTLKAIENSRTIVKNDLLKRVSVASIEVARNRILQELNDNQELHDRLIDESIESIDSVNNNVDEEIA